MFLHACVILFIEGVASGYMTRGSASEGRICIQGSLHRGGGRPGGWYIGYHRIQSTSGHDTSYWNAFLLLQIFGKWRTTNHTLFLNVCSLSIGNALRWSGISNLPIGPKIINTSVISKFDPLDFYLCRGNILPFPDILGVFF